MDDIYLTNQEKRLLFFMRFKKKVRPKFEVSALISYRLIQSNISGEQNSIGEWLKDGTYSITDLGMRFLIKQRKDFMHSFVTPVTVTLLTNAALYVARWLLLLIQQQP